MWTRTGFESHRRSIARTRERRGRRPGCRANDCYERLGARWTEQRIAGERDPHLRARVPRERIDSFWAGMDRGTQLAEALTAFRARLRELNASKAPVVAERHEAVSHAG